MRDTLINNFLRISSIPRVTGNEKEISDFFIEIAKKNNLEYYQDENYNVLIKKRMIVGKPSIIFHAHLDMVGVKTSDSTHDFNTDGIEVIIEGDKVTAKDTTLGADQGVGLAFMLTMIEDNSIDNVEFLFTTEEETTFNGVCSFKYDKLLSKRLINLDYHKDNCVVIGADGDFLNEYVFKSNLIECDLPCYKVIFNSNNAGNSGDAIEESKDNAIAIIGRTLKDKEVYLTSINGGTFENDIATSCEVILHTSLDINELFANVPVNIEKVNNEYSFSLEDSTNIINEINELKSGYIYENIVSSNLGMINTNNDEVKIYYIIRSSDEDKLKYISNRTFNLGYGFSAREVYSDSIWHANKSSELLKLYKEEYFKKYNEYPKEAIGHGSTECAAIVKRVPDLDVISIGANMYYFHTVNEVTYINSWEKVYDLLMGLLKR